MTGTGSVSSNSLKTRRQSLKRQRQTRLLQRIWRSLAIAALSGGMIWLVTRPDWVISDPAQVTIEGNTYLSDDSVRSLLPLTYPQTLLSIQSQVLSQVLQDQAPIAEVTVIRGVFPPSLTVEVVEHQPVAIAIPGPPLPNQTTQPDPIGFIDTQGFWMPKNSYVELEEAPDVPSLTVVGLSDETRADWPAMYAALSRSTVQIFEVDLRSPQNMILRTELGTIHLGPYFSQRFPEQLHTLAQMRKLPDYVQSGEVDYIDLRTPQSPALQLKNDRSQPTKAPAAQRG